MQTRSIDCSKHEISTPRNLRRGLEVLFESRHNSLTVSLPAFLATLLRRRDAEWPLEDMFSVQLNVVPCVTLIVA